MPGALERPRAVRISRWDAYLAVALGLAVLHATSVFGDAPLAVLALVTPLAIVLAIRTYRPAPSDPWVLLVMAGVAWGVAGAIRAAVGATADLTADRHLLPDVFALAGYALFAAGLLRMLRAQGTVTRSRSLVLDGAILTMSTMLVLWVALIAPVLFNVDAAPIAKLSILVYPPISALLVSIAARLAFGTATRGRSQRLLLAGMLAMLVGDVAFVLLETELVGGFPPRLLEAPYAIAYALIGSAALHPSMLDTVRRKAVGAPRTERRLLLIAIALMTPAIALFVWSPRSLLERTVVGGLAVALATTAIIRVVLAARSQAAVEHRLARRATSDELTGLANRTAMHEIVNQQLDDARAGGDTLALLFIDLDRFKLVNDTYGHAVGDELLLAAADRLRTTVGSSDTVARLSGDEFLVSMPRTTARQAKAMASMICDVFSQPFELMGTAWVTASIGIVVADGDFGDVDATSLIRDADTAMYVAKGAGRAGYAMFEGSMRAQSERQLELYNGLHLALEREEFDVHYQCIVNGSSGAVDGVEALVRWNSPTGPIPPDQWISLAEDSHLISAIGEMVLLRACDQVARWRRLPGCSDLTLSVNVSARQLVDVDMVEIVADALDGAGLDPDALWLEITESVMMTDTLDTLAALAGLRGLGVHLSVDDFGTGYSSLSYLQRYPVEQVKIDRQFVQGMCSQSEDAAVVSAIIGIADALGLSIVAEGVESEGQAETLGELGCELLQGFLYSRPVPAIDLGPILIERNEIGFPPSGHRRR